MQLSQFYIWLQRKFILNAIDDYIHRLPTYQGTLVGYLRGVFLATSPKITERIAYGLPFFYCGKPLCYQNIKKEGIDVCFLDGNLIRQHPRFISAERKRVRSLFFRWEEDVDIDLIKEILAEILELPKFKVAKP